MEGDSRGEEETVDPSDAETRPDLGDQTRPVYIEDTLMLPDGAGTGSFTAERLLYGAYEVVHELARGGMGVVYVARHPELDRNVALKVLIAAEHAGPEALERFALEARAAARLRHPNIVGIHHVGLAGDQPYMVMDLIDGSSLRDRIRADGPFPPREAARIVERLARALSYAHSRGILHRDLKPANVLLARSGEDGLEPILTDFGLAKDVEAGSGLTVSGQLLGTPAYMSPEQADGRQDRVDRRSDIYSLGATLYETITGRPPFGGGKVLKVLSDVLTKEPSPPSKLVEGIDRDLETICLKCLEKEPEARYDSAREVAEDLARYLREESIEARRPSLNERLRKWTRRNRTLARTVLYLSTLGAVALASVTVYFVLALRETARIAELRRRQAVTARNDAMTSLREAVAQRARAEREEANARRREQEAIQQRKEARHQSGMLMLEQGARGAEREKDYQREYILRAAAQAGLDGSRQDPVEARALMHLARSRAPRLLWTSPRRVVCRAIAYSRDGRQLVSTDAGLIRVWDARTGRETLSLEGDRVPFSSVAVSPSGDRFAAADVSHRLHVWDGRGRRLKGYRTDTHLVRDMAFSPDGSLLASAGSDHIVRLWDLPTGGFRSLEGHHELVYTVSWSPDGSQLASASRDGTVRIWDVATGNSVRILRHEGRVYAAAYHPRDSVLVSATEDGRILVWNTKTGAELGMLGRHTAAALSLSFSPFGNRLASGSRDGTVKIWRLDPPELVRTIQAHPSEVWEVAFGGDGALVASASLADARVSVWEARTGKQRFTLMGHRPETLEAVGFSRDEKQVISVGPKQVWIWSADDGRPLRSFDLATVEEPKYSLSADGAVLACGGVKSAVIDVWDVTSGKKLRSLARPGGTRTLSLSPDGSLLAVDPVEGVNELWDVKQGSRSPLGDQERAVTNFAFSPDGRRIAWGRYASVWVWDLETGVGQHIGENAHKLAWVVFDASGDRVITASVKQWVWVWDAKTPNPGRELLSQRFHAMGLIVSGDAKHIAAPSGGGWGRAGLFSLDGRFQGGPTTTSERTGCLAFDREGKRLITAGTNGTVRVWKLGMEVVHSVPTAKPIETTTVGPAGEIVLFAWGNAVRAVDRWGSELWTRRYANPVKGLAFSDGMASILGSNGGVQRVDPRTGSGTQSVPPWLPNTRRKVPIAASGSLAIHMTSSGRLRGFDPRDGTRRFDIKAHPRDRKRHWFTAAAISPDGRRFAFAMDHQVQVWDVATLQRKWVLTMGKQTLNSVAFGPAGLLAAGNSYGAVRVWDVETGRRVHDLVGHRRSVLAMAFNNTGDLLATGSSDATIRVWDVKRGLLAAVFHGHTQQVWGLSFGPHNQVLASSSFDRTVRLWRLGAARGVFRATPKALYEEAERETGMRIYGTDLGTAPWLDLVPVR